jgi:hypothetical protein
MRTSTALCGSPAQNCIFHLWVTLSLNQIAIRSNDQGSDPITTS